MNLFQLAHPSLQESDVSLIFHLNKAVYLFVFFQCWFLLHVILKSLGVVRTSSYDSSELQVTWNKEY